MSGQARQTLEEGRWRRLTTTISMFSFIPISVVLALGLMLAVRNFVPPHLLEVQPGKWEIFFSVFGIIYAIIVGFLLVEALRRYHSIESTIEQELNAVEDIRDFMVYLDENEEVARQIRRTLFDYVNSVVNKEWLGMADISKRLNSDTSTELYRLIEVVHKIRITNASDSVALSCIINKIAEVTTYRTERIHLSGQRLSPALRFLITFMSVVLVLGFTIMTMESVWIHGFMVFANAVAVNLLYLVISDLNHPFEELWNITDISFREVAKTLQSTVK